MGSWKKKMTFMRYSMLLFSVVELLLFGCTAGLSRAAQHQSDESESQGARLPRSVPGEPLETTTIPNHLQEDDRDFRFSPFTPKMTITTRDSRTTGKSNQLEPLWVTTTAAPLTKTTNPSFKRTEVKPTFFSKLNITVNSTFSTSISYTTNTLPEQEGSSSSWTTKSTTNPLLTTEKGELCFQWQCDASYCKFLTCTSFKNVFSHFFWTVLFHLKPKWGCTLVLDFTTPSLNKPEVEDVAKVNTCVEERTVRLFSIRYFIFIVLLLTPHHISAILGFFVSEFPVSGFHSVIIIFCCYDDMQGKD